MQPVATANPVTVATGAASVDVVIPEGWEP